MKIYNTTNAKSPTKPKRIHIDIVVTEEQYNFIISKAAECGMTKSAYLRALGLNHKPHLMMTAEQEQALASLSGARQELIGFSNALNNLSPEDKIRLFKSVGFMQRWLHGITSLIRQWTSVRDYFLNCNVW